MKVRDEKCGFNIIYKLDKNLDVGDCEVADVRNVLAKAIVKQVYPFRDRYDFVVPIPRTGKFYTPIIADELGVPEINLFYKNKLPKTLGMETEKRASVYSKLSLAEDFHKYKDKRILLVDEALISGFTCTFIANLLSSHDFNYFSFAFIAPSIYLHCPFDHLARGKHLQLSQGGMSEYFKGLGAKDYYFGTESFFETMDRVGACSMCFFDKRYE